MKASKQEVTRTVYTLTLERGEALALQAFIGATTHLDRVKFIKGSKLFQERAIVGAGAMASLVGDLYDVLEASTK